MAITVQDSIAARSTVGFTKTDTADAVIVAGLIECARQINDGGWGDAVEDE